MTRPEARRMALSGPLVMGTVNRVLEGTRVAGPENDLIIDFSQATDIDSSALALMLQWRREAELAGHTVTFEGVPHNLKVLAELYGVSFLLDHHPIPD